MSPRLFGVPLVVALYLGAVLLPVQFWLGPLLMTAPRLLLLGALIPALLRVGRGAAGPLQISDLLLPAFVAWSAVALEVNAAGTAWQNAGSTGLELLGGYVLGRAYIRTHADFVALCRLLAVAIVALLPVAIYEAIRGQAPILAALHAVPGLDPPDLVAHPRRLGMHRVQAVFAHPILFGTFCASVFLLCLVGLRGIIADGARRALAIAVALCAFLSLSSGVLLALALQLALLVWARTTRRLPLRWWLVMVGLAALYLAVDLLSTRSPLRVFMSYATFSTQTAYYREAIYHWGFVNIAQNPAFGIGLRDWLRPDWMVSPSMDSFWLVVAVRFGLPGIALLALALGAGLWRVGRSAAAADRRLDDARRAWLFTMLALCFTLATVDVWTNLYSYFFFLFGAGLWLGEGPQPTPAAPRLRRDAPVPPLRRAGEGLPPLRRRPGGPE